MTLKTLLGKIFIQIIFRPLSDTVSRAHPSENVSSTIEKTLGSVISPSGAISILVRSNVQLRSPVSCYPIHSRHSTYCLTGGFSSCPALFLSRRDTVSSVILDVLTPFIMSIMAPFSASVKSSFRTKVR